MDATLAALADHHRRRIVEALTDGERTAGDLGAHFAISQPAVSKHLRVLREAGLVTSRSQATRRFYRLSPAPLAEADAWFARHRHIWRDYSAARRALIRYPVRPTPDPDACGRRLRSFGLPTAA